MAWYAGIARRDRTTGRVVLSPGSVLRFIRHCPWTLCDNRRGWFAACRLIRRGQWLASIVHARTRAWDYDTRLYLHSLAHRGRQDGVKTYRTHVGTDWR